MLPEVCARARSEGSMCVDGAKTKVGVCDTIWRTFHMQRYGVIIGFATELERMFYGGIRQEGFSSGKIVLFVRYWLGMLKYVL